jgi:hypothetical protein
MRKSMRKEFYECKSMISESIVEKNNLTKDEKTS